MTATETLLIAFATTYLFLMLDLVLDIAIHLPCGG